MTFQFPTDPRHPADLYGSAIFSFCLSGCKSALEICEQMYRRQTEEADGDDLIKLSEAIRQIVRIRELLGEVHRASTGHLSVPRVYLGDPKWTEVHHGWSGEMLKRIFEDLEQCEPTDDIVERMRKAGLPV